MALGLPLALVLLLHGARSSAGYGLSADTAPPAPPNEISTPQRQPTAAPSARVSITSLPSAQPTRWKTCTPSQADWSGVYNSTSFATIVLDPGTNETSSFSPGSDHVEHTITAGPSPYTFTYASSETWPFVCISEPCTQCQPTLRCSSVEYTGIKLFYAEVVVVV